MIFTWSAPWRICSRALRRASSAPSARAMQNTMALQQPHDEPLSVRRRESLWPPVGPIARAEMKRRGPARSPLSTAALIPQSAPPVSRTVVKPRSIMARMLSAAPAAVDHGGVAGLKGPVRHLADQLALNEHLVAAQQLILRGIQQLHVAEQISAHRRLPGSDDRPGA